MNSNEPTGKCLFCNNPIYEITYNHDPKVDKPEQEAMNGTVIETHSTPDMVLKENVRHILDKQHRPVGPRGKAALEQAAQEAIKKGLAPTHPALSRLMRKNVTELRPKRGTHNDE